MMSDEDRTFDYQTCDHNLSKESKNPSLNVI
jgi:hypothetical protein